MRPVRISPDYGIVVRRAALAAHAVTLEQLVAAMEAPPFDESGELLSFGPHFGGEAADEFRRRLDALGLVYIDDFFVFEEPFPPWCAPFGGLAS